VSAQETQYSCSLLAASRFVHCYLQRKGRLGGVGLTIPVIARSRALLDFELGDILQIRSCSTGLAQPAEPATLVGLETYVQIISCSVAALKALRFNSAPQR
jgi:hypothetical protein